MAVHPELDWQSPELRQLDLCFGDLDPAMGIYFTLAANDAVDRIVDPPRVAHFKRHPPSDTRAHARTALIRQLGDDVVSVDWDEVRVRHGHRLLKVLLPEPDQALVSSDDETIELLEQRTRVLRHLKPFIGY